MRVLDLYITKVCNLDCEYCYVDVVKKEDSSFQSQEFLERINLLEYDSIKFFGGEPLVKWKEIREIVDLVSKKNPKIEFTIVTNGILIGKSKISYILEKNINIVVSIHEGSFPHLKKNISTLKMLGSQVGFYIIFDPSHFDITLRNFLFFFKNGFTNFCFAPEIYGDWNDKNLSALQKILTSLTPYILKYKLGIAGISHNSLKIINRGCEKSVYDEKGKFSPCNRFKSLGKKEKFNYKEVYDLFDEQLGFDSDPMKWFYICPVGWYLDNEKKDLELSVQRFKKLNHVFIDFYREIHKHHLTFFSKNIEQIRFNLTQQCNLRCEYCYVDFKNEILDVKVGKNIIDFFLFQEGNHKQFAFFGGEPLLEFNILKELVIYANALAKKLEKTLEYSIATNFTIIDQEKVNFLQDHNFAIHISLNGNIQSNDKLRDMSSKLVFKNIDTLFIKQQKNEICILFAFGPGDISDIYTNLSFLVERGFVIFNLELIFGKKYIWKIEDINRACQRIGEIKLKYPDIRFLNTEKKSVFLDINTDGVCGENSLEFYGGAIDKSIKQRFDIALRDIS